MKILAIETTGACASVALIDEWEQVKMKQSERTMSHLQNLIPMIEELLTDSILTINDITAIAVSRGPGSFTGIRIGVATARALAQAAGLPCIAVPTLKSYAWNDRLSSTGMEVVCPMLDARRSQVYGGAYYWRDGICYEVVDEGAYDPLDLLDRTAAFAIAENKPIVVYGDGAAFCREKTAEWKEYTISNLSQFRDNPYLQKPGFGDVPVTFATDSLLEARASSVAKLALQLYQEGKTVSYEELEPVYLRKAEAERKLLERLAQEAKAKAAAEAAGVAGNMVGDAGAGDIGVGNVAGDAGAGEGVTGNKPESNGAAAVAEGQTSGGQI